MKIRKNTVGAAISVLSNEIWKKDLLNFTMKTEWCQHSKIFSDIGIALQDNRFILENIEMLI